MIDTRQAGSGPLYRQIYDRVRQGIAEGRLQAGYRLPSARSYAQELGVARGTVDLAYALLAGEGYVETHGRAGTIVAPAARPMAPAGNRPPAAADGTPGAMAHRHSLMPLAAGVPAFDLFPRTAWARILRRQASTVGRAELAYPDPQGSARLRAAVAAYLHVARGVTCTPDEVVVTGGFQAGLAMTLRALLKPGDAVWIEDPGYSMVGIAVREAGMVPIPIPVDENGLDITEGIARAPAARLAVVAPAHQFPMGVSLSLARRRQLLDWAEAADAWVLEDDFDGEFRYNGRPLPALKSIDRQGRVLYAGTFSKTFFPGLRLGYLVAPPAALERLRRGARYLDGGRGTLEQEVVADFVAQGQFARHVRKMRTAYRSRRAAMTEALTRRFGARGRVEQSAGGLHLVLRLPGETARLAGINWVRGDALGALPMHILTDLPIHHDRLVVGFANVVERQAPHLADQLFTALYG